MITCANEAINEKIRVETTWVNILRNMTQGSNMIGGWFIQGCFQ